MNSQQRRVRPVATFITGRVETRIWPQDGRTGDLWRVDQVCTHMRTLEGRYLKSFALSDLDDLIAGARLAKGWLLRQGRRRSRFFRWFVF